MPHRWWVTCLAGLALLAALTAAAPTSSNAHPGIPALTPGQRAQAETAVDGSDLVDEPALYGLLANVASWPNPLPVEAPEPPRNPSGSPDSAKIPENPGFSGASGVETGLSGAVEERSGALSGEVGSSPGALRGQLVTVQGTFVGRPRRMTLARPGPWGAELTEWGIAVDLPNTSAPTGAPSQADAPTQASPRSEPDPTIIMVYFVDPQAELAAPRRGAAVRVVGRFYKVWRDVDAHGVATDYPVVVARSAELVKQSPQAMAGRTLAATLIAGIVALLFLLWWVRQFTRKDPDAEHRRRVQTRLRRDAEERDNDAEAFDDQDAATLPRDPAAALAALEDEVDGDTDTNEGKAREH